MSGESQISLSFQFWLGRASLKDYLYSLKDYVWVLWNYLSSALQEIFTKSQITRGVENVHNNLKIHGIRRTSLAQSMGNMFVLNVQKTLEAYTTTTRGFF